VTGTDDDALPFLMASLKEVQDTVRGYDLKAQIVGVGYIFAINIIFNLGRAIAGTQDMHAAAVTAAWALFIFPIALFGAVLYPTRKMAPKLGDQGSGALRTFYVKPDRIHDVDAYLADVDASDIKKEIAYELLRTAGLREIKRRRFLRALWVAALSFVTLFMLQLLRSENLLQL
jgi:hypothetical protein